MSLKTHTQGQGQGAKGDFDTRAYTQFRRNPFFGRLKPFGNQYKKTERRTGRQRGRETEQQTERQTESQADSQTERETFNYTYFL